MEELMHRGFTKSPAVYRALVFVIALALLGQPFWAQGNNDDHRVFPQRPPAGFARPPIHLRGTNATKGPSGMSPSATRHAYGFDLISNQGAGQVIGIVDAYDDPKIESDLGVFDSTFSLPACTSSNGCFRKLYAQGSRPRTNSGWALEISLDVEWAHAIAPQANILPHLRASWPSAERLSPLPRVEVMSARLHGAGVVAARAPWKTSRSIKHSTPSPTTRAAGAACRTFPTTAIQ